MTLNPEQHRFDIDIPTQPQSLLELSLLLAEEDLALPAVSALIESDMALASAVLKAVNTSAYAVRGGVQSVQQAVSYLGVREVAAITFEMGMRAAFPPAPELEPIWDRAARRGRSMARMAMALGLDAWAAHSAGLFEECGKAVLFRHASDHYRAMLRAATDDLTLSQLERAGFGVAHDLLGASLCEGWGLGEQAVHCVRHHVQTQAERRLVGGAAERGLGALSVLAWLLDAPAPHEQAALEAAALDLAAQAGLAPEPALKALRREQAQRQADRAEQAARVGA